MRKIITLLTSLTLLVTVTSCEIEPITSGYAVYFKCDMTRPPFDQITSSGQFITVRRNKSNGSYVVTDFKGDTTYHYLSKPELLATNNRGYDYGLGGLIIGTPSMQDGNSKICAYDLACPNCDNPRHRLELVRDATGHATCHNCGVVFGLNIGGIPVQGKGNGKKRVLWPYRCNIFGMEVEVIN